MSVPNTTLANNFNTWRVNTNTVSTNLGDIATLTTTATTAIGGINELHTEHGTLTSLTTTDKSTFVAAINELDGEIGTLSSLTTTLTSTLVGAINELDGEIGVLSTLNTTDKSTLVAAINETLASITSVSSINDLSGTLSVAKGGTGQTSLSNVVAGSNKVTITNGSSRVIGGDITINIAESNLTLQNLGGTLTVAKGGTGRTSLDDIVPGSNIITVTNGSDTVVGGDVTIDIVTTNITSVGTLTTLAVSGAATVGGLVTANSLAVTTTATFNHTLPPTLPNVPVANITTDKQVATKEYVDSVVATGRNTEVEFDSGELPPLRKSSGEAAFTMNHGMSAEPNFIMAYLGGYAGNGSGEMPSFYLPAMSCFSASRFTPYYTYNGTTISLDHGTDTDNYVARIQEPGANKDNVGIQNDEAFFRYFAVNKSPDYTSGWNNVITANTTVTLAHGLGEFPTIVIAEMAENSDGSGWRVPIMSMAAANPTYQCCVVKIDNTNIIIRSTTNLANIYSAPGTTATPTTGYIRVQAYNSWTPDYDSTWVSISDSGSTAEHLLQHDLGIKPSIVMLYLSDDTSIIGTTDTPTGTWVTQALSADINRQGVHILYMNEKFAYVQAGTTETHDLYDSTGTRRTGSGPIVFRLLAWK